MITPSDKHHDLATAILCQCTDNEPGTGLALYFSKAADMIAAYVADLEHKNTQLIKAGNALAEYLSPPPIPTTEPTERDYLLADWNEATALAIPAHSRLTSPRTTFND